MSAFGPLERLNGKQKAAIVVAVLAIVISVASIEGRQRGLDLLNPGLTAPPGATSTTTTVPTTTTSTTTTSSTTTTTSNPISSTTTSLSTGVGAAIVAAHY